MTGLPRHIAIAAAVLALHVAAAWALNAGLRARAVDIVVPVQMLAALVDAPAPAAQSPSPPVPPAPSPPAAPPSAQKTPPSKAAPRPTPWSKPVRAATPSILTTPLPSAVEPIPWSTAPTPSKVTNAAPADALATQAVATPSATPVAAPKVAGPPSATSSAPALAAPTASAAPPAAFELPSADARYLQNPKPRYPPISHRLGEQGTVLVQVLVSEAGLAQDAQVKASSGFYRLDNAAVTTVLTWRFVPGKRAGVPQAMWFIVPITFGIQ